MPQSRKKKVLYIIESLSFGGVERRRLSLVKRINEGYDVEIICSQTVGDLYKEFIHLGVPIHEVGILGFPWKLGVILKTLKVARRFSPDIIHGAVFEGITLANISGWFIPKAQVISEETSDPQNRGKMSSFLLRILTVRSSVIVGVSRSVTSYLNKTVQQNKVKQISNGVEDNSVVDEKEVTQLKSQLDIQDNDFVVGFVGRLRDFHKRVSDLISAANILFESYDNLKVLVVGGGFDENTLKKQARGTLKPSNFIFVGAQSDPNPYYACMNAFCIPSHMEAFGLVLVEAMFHGLPVIATKVGGMIEIVEDEKTGYLVERYSPNEIAHSIQKLMTNKGLAESFGQNGRSRAQKLFSADRYSSDVMKLYQCLLNE